MRQEGFEFAFADNDQEVDRLEAVATPKDGLEVCRVTLFVRKD